MGQTVKAKGFIYLSLGKYNESVWVHLYYPSQKGDMVDTESFDMWDSSTNTKTEQKGQKKNY